MSSRFRLQGGKPWLVPAGILTLALLLRLWRLGDSNLWWDEALAIWAVRKGLVGVTVWTAGDVHPPLFFWSLWGWVSALGESEFAMRLLSVSLGVLTVAAVYALAHRLAGRRAAIWASLLTAIAPFHVWWSQEMRMYVLAGLLCVLSLYALIRWLDDERSGSACSGRLSFWFWAYIAATTASLYTIFLVGVVVVAQNIAVGVALCSRYYDRRRLFWRWVMAEMAVGALVAVWLAFSWERMPTWSVSEPTTLRFVAELYASLLASGVSEGIRQVWWAWLPLLGVLLAGAVLAVTPAVRTSVRWSHIVAVGLSGFLAVLFVYAATLPRSLFYTPRIEARYLLPFAPMVWVMLGWALELVANRWRTIGLVAGAVLVGISAGFLPRYYEGRVLDDELQSMVRYIVSQAEPDDVVLLDSGSRYPVFLYYYERLADVAARPTVRLVPELPVVAPPGDVAAVMQELVGDADRIWLAEVEAHLTDPGGLARGWLAEQSEVVVQERYSYNALTLYADQGQLPTLNLRVLSPQHGLPDVSLGGGTLAGWELPVEEFEPTSWLHLTLLWEQAPVQLVSVELLTRAGQIVARRTLAPALRQQFDWQVDETWPRGTLHVRARSVEEIVELGELQVLHTARSARQLTDAGALPCFGQSACLRGYALTDASGRDVSHARAGDLLYLDLVWLATAPQQELVVFSHLLGQAHNPATSGPVWGQSDSPPAGGAVSTKDWQTGDVVMDRHIIRVDAVAPPGEYTIEVGLYSAADARRLMVEDTQPAKDHWILPISVTIE